MKNTQLLSNQKLLNTLIGIYSSAIILPLFIALVGLFFIPEPKDIFATINQKKTTLETISEIVLVVIQMALAITPILFLVWFYRSYKNLHIAGMHPRFRPGWAVGSFFIIILNFFLPYIIMQEIWAKTQQIGIPKAHHKYIPKTSPFIIVWWTFWLLIFIPLFLFIVYVFISKIFGDFGLLAGIFSFIVLGMVGYVLVFVDILVLIILLVYAKRHEREAFARLSQLNQQTP